MASAELIFAAVGGADLCLKYGKELIEAYQTYKTADENIKAKVLLIEATWSRTRFQVGLFNRVVKTMDEEHCHIHMSVFDMLSSTLEKSTKQIEAVLKRSKPDAMTNKYSVRKWKLLFVGRTIEKTIADLEKWQRIFDPTWFLMLRIGDCLIDSALHEAVGPSTTSQNTPSDAQSQDTPISSTLVMARDLRAMIKSESSADLHVSLKESGLEWDSVTEIAHSTTRLIQRTPSQKWVALDTILCDSCLDIASARADAESLAKKLGRVNPDTFSLLSCHGLVKRKSPSTGQLASLNLIFRLPAAPGPPTSLRRLLLEPAGYFGLSQIIGVARQLAQAVAAVHSCDFVHKNVRPEAILVFPGSGEASGSLGSACLLGFDSFRSLYFHTLRQGDAAWERNLYRHPRRQGLHAQDKYIMQHDVYGLGVCLLEMGLWQSFVLHEDGGGGVMPSDALGLTVDDFDYSGTESLEKAEKIKTHLVKLAWSGLPSRMGDLYAAVVVTCLTCLDNGNEDFGDEKDLLDDDGILPGIRFIERVLFRLSEICL